MYVKSVQKALKPVNVSKNNGAINMHWALAIMQTRDWLMGKLEEIFLKHMLENERNWLEMLHNIECRKMDSRLLSCFIACFVNLS